MPNSIEPSETPIPWSRREFVVSMLTTGFALAVRPVGAQTITTDAQSLDAGEVKIPVKDGQIPGYRAAPAGKRDAAVILVVQEIFGVHEHIKDVCRRLAKQGYFAVAPELFARQGDVSKLSDFSEIRKVVSQVPDAQVMGDLDATVAWAEATGTADTKRLGITGFCWGGRVVWLYAAHNPQLDAGVAWYGRLVGESTPLTPKHPVDVASELKAPVLGLYGGADTGIPVETVEKMRAALKQAGKTADVVVYPDAPHAFFADYRQSYRKEPAQDGWARMLAWFKQHGVASNQS
ncbi:MAG TPA: dienelactone hydrolase family protein [Burkholderiales bacterium]|nr:dienelactone hydrolase family protein [Burkholderiales bacterium]